MAEESSSGGSGSINVPGLGSMKRTHVFVLVAAAVGVVGYAYWQRGKNAEPVYLDPAELSYGEPIDTTTSPTTGGLTVGYNNEYDDDPTFGAPRTNAEWSARAVDRLSYLNYDGQVVAVAIGKYLARQQLNTAEAEIIRTIHGLIGRPPEGDYPILLGPNTPSDKPYILYFLEGSNPPTWARAGGPEKWQEISGANMQGKANEWAVSMPSKQAIRIGQAEWIAKKAEYTK